MLFSKLFIISCSVSLLIRLASMGDWYFLRLDVVTQSLQMFRSADEKISPSWSSKLYMERHVDSRVARSAWCSRPEASL